MNLLNIVIRKQCDTLIRSPEQVRYTDKYVAFRLGQSKRDFDASELHDS